MFCINNVSIECNSKGNNIGSAAMKNMFNVQRSASRMFWTDSGVVNKLCHGGDLINMIITIQFHWIILLSTIIGNHWGIVS